MPCTGGQRHTLYNVVAESPNPNERLRGQQPCTRGRASGKSTDETCVVAEIWRIRSSSCLPDLVLICGGELCNNSMTLFGFPSWLLLQAELGVLPALHRVTRADLTRQLWLYSRTTQRFGK